MMRANRPCTLVGPLLSTAVANAVGHRPSNRQMVVAAEWRATEAVSITDKIFFDKANLFTL